uniref:hypothetical protein n=1 Tax=Streptomyces sp. DG1A-41 TaxID=3125779 RepID=UPI00403FFB72
MAARPPPSGLPGLGAPILAVAEAGVVRAADGRRDHLSRTQPGLLYLMLHLG